MKATKKKPAEPRSVYSDDMIERIEKKDPDDRTSSERRLLKRVKRARDQHGNAK